MNSPVSHLGELLSFATALVWAFSVILFKKGGETAGPLALNLFKNALTFVLLLPTLLVFGIEFFPPEVTAATYGIVLLGGLLSIGLADTTFFRSLNLLGAGRFAVIDTMYSPAIILLAFLFLGERLTKWQWIGVLAVLSGVLLATWEPKRVTIERRRMVAGTLWGLVSILLMAAGLTVIKPVLSAQHLLWVTFWRVAGGLLTVVLLIVFHPRRRRLLGGLGRREGRIWIFLGSLVGAYLVTLLWLGGMKYTSLSVAAVLNQTSTVLTFVLAALFLHEPVTQRRAGAIVLACGGVFAVTFG